MMMKSINAIRNHRKKQELITNSSSSTLEEGLVNPFGAPEPSSRRKTNDEKEKDEWELGDPTISVVGERFCNPYPMELIVKRKIQNMSNSHMEVHDLSGNLLLKVDGNIWRFGLKKVMTDANGFVILTMRGKAITWKNKWKVYRGESCEREDLLFRTHQSNVVKLRTSVDVFLADNIKKQVANFKAYGKTSNISFNVFKGPALIAEVKHEFSWGNVCKGKDNFMVTVNPEVDYAFIVALIVIIDDIENGV